MFAVPWKCTSLFKRSWSLMKWIKQKINNWSLSLEQILRNKVASCSLCPMQNQGDILKQKVIHFKCTFACFGFRQRITSASSSRWEETYARELIVVCACSLLSKSIFHRVQSLDLIFTDVYFFHRVQSLDLIFTDVYFFTECNPLI